MDVTSEKGARGGGVLLSMNGGLNSSPFVIFNSSPPKHGVLKLQEKIGISGGGVVVVGIPVVEIDVELD